MANSDNATGLTLARQQGSSAHGGNINRYVALAATGTDIFVGGLVKPAGTADADGVMDVTGNVATGDAVLGVVVGIEPVTADSLVYREASTLRYIYVADDPNALFEVQEDSVGAAMAVTAVGNTADLASFTSGRDASGKSLIEIDSSTATASGDGTEDVLIVGLVQRADNEIGDNAKWLVRLNNHFFVDAQAGA